MKVNIPRCANPHGWILQSMKAIDESCSRASTTQEVHSTDSNSHVKGISLFRVRKGSMVIGNSQWLSGKTLSLLAMRLGGWIMCPSSSKSMATDEIRIVCTDVCIQLHEVRAAGEESS